MPTLRFLLAFLLTCVSWNLLADVRPLAAQAPTSISPDALKSQMDQAWAVTWDRFFQDDVQTFADYLSSYEPGQELAHLPTAEEVQRQYPNPCGYSTGMEDGMILGGAMLSILADRYEVTNQETLREKAKQVFRGLHRCATVHASPDSLPGMSVAKIAKAFTSIRLEINTRTECTDFGSTIEVRFQTKRLDPRFAKSLRRSRIA